MSAGYQELFLEQGSDYSTSITLTDVNGDPYDLTDYTAKSQVKKSYYSTNNTAVFTATINDAATGNVQISLSAANTTSIKAGRYVYDVEVEDASGNISRIFEGIVNVLPNVTKS